MLRPSAKSKRRPNKLDHAAQRQHGKGKIPVAGIGASAGGLEAFTELLNALPDNTGIAFVLVQHLDPKHQSVLPELLSRATKMPVVEATNGVRVASNHVYIITPNTSLTIAGSVLRVAKRKVKDGAHMPIDLFFKSLAEDRKAGAIGIILSGTASDGVLGLRSIKTEGGVTFAQDPSSAKFDGMPQSAIAAGCVDFVRSPNNIAQELVRIMKHPYLNGRHEPESDKSSNAEARALNDILAILKRTKRTDFAHYRSSTVQRRIARRMAVHNIPSRADFAKYLRRNADAVDGLFQDLLICVTHFFREHEKYKLLARRVFPKVAKAAAASNSIRVWVPGCSTGEEAYSIAIALSEFIEGSAFRYRFRFLERI